jgi:hypothetical protein
MFYLGAQSRAVFRSTMRSQENQGVEFGDECDVEDISTPEEVDPHCGSMFFTLRDNWLY